MIYSFTPEESEQLQIEITPRITAAQAESKEKLQEDRTADRINDVYEEYREQISRIKHDLIDLIDEIEERHFQQLKTQEDIIEDARRIAHEAIIVLVDRIKYTIENVEESKRLAGETVTKCDYPEIINVDDTYFAPDPFHYDYTELIEDNPLKRVFPKKQAPFLFDINNIEYPIFEIVLERHTKAMQLAGQEAYDNYKSIIIKDIYATGAVYAPIREKNAKNKNYMLTTDTLLMRAMLGINGHKQIEKRLEKGDVDGMDNFIVDEAGKDWTIFEIEYANGEHVTVMLQEKDFTPNYMDRPILECINNTFLDWRKSYPNEPCLKSAEDIYRRMAGLPMNAVVTEAQALEIKSVLYRYCSLATVIRRTSKKPNNKKDPKITTYSGTFCKTMSTGYFSDNGSFNIGIHIYGPNIYYELSKDTGKFFDAPYNLVERNTKGTEKKERIEGVSITWRDEFIRCIGAMKESGRSTSILLSSLYADTKTPTPEERIEQKAKEGYIDNDGNKAKGYATPKAKQNGIRQERFRDKKKLLKELEKFISQNWIDGYTFDDKAGKIEIILYAYREIIRTFDEWEKSKRIIRYDFDKDDCTKVILSKAKGSDPEHMKHVLNSWYQKNWIVCKTEKITKSTPQIEIQIYAAYIIEDKILKLMQEGTAKEYEIIKHVGEPTEMHITMQPKLDIDLKSLNKYVISKERNGNTIKLDLAKGAREAKKQAGKK